MLMSFRTLAEPFVASPLKSTDIICTWADSVCTLPAFFGVESASSEAISLKHSHKSIRNKGKFIKLDDGTLGILPDEWVEKFNSYFNAGELVEEQLHTYKINYHSIADLYEEHLFDE